MVTRRPSSGTWPDSHWGSLFLQATALLRASCPTAYWTFGGGTALALKYGHRVSYDVDIFLRDAQVLAYLTPRTNDIAASLATSYAESANGIRIETSHGDIDFVVSAEVTDVAPAARLVQGKETLVEAPAEILAKKIQYRGHRFAHRDVFDLAMLMDQDPHEVETALSSCGRDAVEKAAHVIAARLPSLTSELPNYVNPTQDFVSLIDRVPAIVVRFPGVEAIATRRAGGQSEPQVKN